MLRSSLLALAALLVVGAPARAAIVSVPDAGGPAVFFDEAGTDDAVRAQVTDAGLRVYDAIEPRVRAGDGCSPVSAHTVLCPGATRLRAFCGRGFDTVVRPDRTTFVGAGCESVSFVDQEPLALHAHALSVAAKGVWFRLSCPDYSVNDFGEWSPCQGRIRLWRDGKLLALGRFDVERESGRNVLARLTTAGRALIGRAPGIDVLASVDIPGDTGVGLYPARGQWRVFLHS